MTSDEALAAATSTSRTGDVLVVDDAPEELRLLALLLTDAGFRVRTARSGAEALAAAHERVPDLVLLDVDMPEMNGYEICRRFRDDPDLRAVPILFLSGLDASEDKLAGFAAGGVDYITKPFRIDEVRARLETHLELRRLRREAEERNRELDATVQRLRQVERLRHDLVQMVAHDMRSPLMGVSGYLELLEMEQGSLSEDHREFVGRALEAARTLVRHVDALLDADRLESDRLPLELGHHDLAQLIEQAIASLGPYGRPRVQWTERPDGGAKLDCDAELVARVVSNLLANALGFSEEEDPVEVSLRPANGDRWRVEVRDRGAAISPELVPRVFDTNATPGSARGRARSMGLGLAFCKLAVGAHRGEIGLTPGSAGGNTFWFELPSAPSGGS